MKSSLHAAAAAVAVIATATTAAGAADVAPPPIQVQPPSGSLYLQCDGQPNNMTTGEGLARFVGAVTLLGIFAKPREVPNPAKRQFGAAGVQACSQLIDGGADGKGSEGNGLRRIPLILARAVHHIEAKDYQQAIDDVDKARGEAAALHLVGNPYFDTSMGLSFNRIEAAARLRMGDPAAAQAVALRDVARHKFDLYAVLTGGSFSDFLPQMSPQEEQYLQLMSRIVPEGAQVYADRLDEVGRSADAARLRDDLVTFIDSLSSKDKQALPPARAALGHALAGDFAKAATLADTARTIIDDRRAAGNPETDASQVVEILDLVTVVQLAHDGKLADARRNFAARSQWLEPSFGAVMEVNRRLRQGASEAELFGALADTPEKLWQQRRDARLARLLKSDSDNKTLFNAIFPYAKVEDYEAASKAVWNTDKSKMMLKKQSDTGYWTIFSSSQALVSADAIMLHAALQAKAKGKHGFIIVILPRRPMLAFVRFADPADGTVPASMYLDADAVIAELQQTIPTPEAIKARQATRST